MENFDMLLDPIKISLTHIGEFLPRLVLAIVVLIAGWLIAKLIRLICVRGLRARGFAVYAADMRATAELVSVAGLPRVALAFGNENRGVSRALRDECDGAFCVPMRGMVESYNVSVAAAMALYEVTRGRAGDLSVEERDADALREWERYLAAGGPGAPWVERARAHRDRLARIAPARPSPPARRRSN